MYETALELKMTKCQLKVYEDMHDMRRDVHVMAGRVSVLEKGHKDIQLTLSRHEEQRRGLYAESDRKLEAILDKIGIVATESNDNAQWISKVNKWRLKVTFLGAGIAGTIASIYWAITFLQKYGVVFMINKVN
jgi:hypothetical protein